MTNASHISMAARSAANPALLLGAFTCTLFASAFLLFGLQPLFAKLVLPRLGGSSAVWSFALVFFQTVLLAGYAYAHVLSKVSPARAMAVHSVILAAGFAALPVGVTGAWANAASGGDPAALAVVFGLGAGLPFFAVSATAPLLQSWFARTGHHHAADPYFLYGASNLGSFLALAAYPFIVEPLLPLSAQIGAWTFLYAGLACAILMCGSLAASAFNGNALGAAGAPAAQPVSSREFAIWAALAAVPSGLLVSVTAHISTDLVAAPFLWVVPLALFLLTFVIVFQRNPLISHGRALWLQSMAAAPFAALLFARKDAEFIVIGLHLAVFFISAMVCHGTLAARRPAAERLTSFYLAMSLGGVAGGVFASIISPQIFSRIYEYPILLCAAFLCRPDIFRMTPGIKNAACLAWLGAAGLLAVLGVSAAARALISELVQSHGSLLLVVITFAVFAVRRLALAQAPVIAIGVGIMAAFGGGEALYVARSPFGVHMVSSEDDGTWHILRHGTTRHGAQRWMDDNGLKLAGPPAPAAYFYAEGPMGAAISGLRRARGGTLDAAIIGLGTGALACHQTGSENWRFFEIDQAVIDIARNPGLFTYIDQCAPDTTIILGDGRLRIADEAPNAFDLIVIDAFSSDSIPVHLLTREAVALYRSKLKPGGMILFHVSNRFMKLEGIVAATAGGAVFVNTNSFADWPFDIAARQYRPQVALAFGNPAEAAFLAGDRRWLKLDADPGQTPWTDDYSNVIGAIWQQLTSTPSGSGGNPAAD